jgi:molybdenum cofactor cytidylyltransferase
MASHLNLAILILAGGESKRLGSPKQLLDWNGQTLLRHSISTAQQFAKKLYTFSRIYTVLGAHYDEFSTHIEDTGVITCHNEQFHTGIASSIRGGITSISNTQADAVLIMLCDQPLVTVEYLQKLIQKFAASEKGITATKYPQASGVPAFFTRKYFDALLGLRGNQGAKSLIKRFEYDTETIIFNGENIDIDTVEDYERALYMSHHKV